MSALALSVVLSFVSAVAYAGGAIIQEQVAVTSPGQTYAPLHRPGWWAAVALTGLGGLLHVVALAFGPLSLVQPLGALTIVFALPMAALFVGRRAGAAAWRGAIMATLGLAGLLALVGASDAQSLSNAQRLALGVVAGGAVAALMVAGRAAHRHPAVRSVLLAVAAGVAFSMSSVFTKTVAVDWSEHVSLADLSSLAAIGVFATAGMLISQASYRGAGLEAPLATLTVVNPVVAAAVGITMFGETFRYGATGTALALGCGVVAAGGLILLTIERIGSGDRTAATSPEPAAVPQAVAGQPADGAPEPTGEPAPVAVAAVSESRLPEPVVPAVSDQRLPESVLPVAADLGALTVTEATVEALLAGLPKPAGGEYGFVPAPQPGAASVVPPAPRAGGEGVLLAAPQPVVGGVLVPAPLRAARPAMEVGAAQDHAAARDELPFLTAMLGVPYVPMPFVNHHRTRVKS
ncbi:DMT family transporter [Streptomyces rhizosphaerihabitans]|uniref:DMT family transporter n=1 Tax=Streptomyces rhizosphaerihabitans TaxID=1266770 RepID=UPI0021C1BA5F|nr:DMT family transporter [Streptomyces rhizosphaerihabitans]MCT9008275.1 DMT family transporter [Streptomyces rhizosphaerihabitans]